MYEFICDIMRDASKIMLNAHDIHSTVTEKTGSANFVTIYDTAVQEKLISALHEALPEAIFIAEESSENPTDLLANNLAFIIDPIDGTTNFIHNCLHSAISVALCDHGTIIFGAIYHPYQDRMYYAEKGCGAFVEHGGMRHPIHVSDRALCDGLAAVGTAPYYKDTLGKHTFDVMYTLFNTALDVRRFGSAALDMCMVACGMVDVYIEYLLSPWDFAAGSLIVEEAGGIISTAEQKPLRFDMPISVVAGNPTAYRDLIELNIL